MNQLRIHLYHVRGKEFKGAILLMLLEDHFKLLQISQILEVIGIIDEWEVVGELQVLHVLIRVFWVSLSDSFQNKPRYFTSLFFLHLFTFFFFLLFYHLLTLLHLLFVVFLVDYIRQVPRQSFSIISRHSICAWLIAALQFSKYQVQML